MLRLALIIITGFLMISPANAQPPKNAVLAYRNGVTLRDKAMYPEAIQSFKKAALLYKKYDSAYLQMGEICLKQNKADTAVLYYNKALEINPQQVLAYIALGGIYRNIKAEFDKAISYYSSALKIDNRNKETLCNIAWCYNSQKQYDSAIMYAAKALDLDNDYKAGYGELGHAVHASKKYAEGLEQFRKNMSLSANPLPVLYSGLIYIELKDKENALKMYERLEKTDSTMAGRLKKQIENAKY